MEVLGGWVLLNYALAGLQEEVKLRRRELWTKLSCVWRIDSSDGWKKDVLMDCE